MYNYTPIITTPVDDFKQLFKSDNASFVFYISDEQELLGAISSIISMSKDEYSKICHSAHNKVKDSTWLDYAESLLKLIDNDSSNL